MLHFVYPLWLFTLALLPLVALVLLQFRMRERRDLEGYAQRGALMKMGLWRKGRGSMLRSFLVLASLAMGIVALAEPRWGGGNGAGSEARDGSLVVVMDVSRSMLAQDMGGESRLLIARRAVDKLLPALAGWKVGVVGFAGEGRALVPLTSDHNAVDTLLARMQPGEVEGKGSNVEAGIRAAIPLFNRSGRHVILLMSDGEELSGDATKAIAAAKDAQVEIDAVGLGTPEGGFIPGPPDVWGNPAYLTYRGEKVTSKLTEAPLKALASGTNGFYTRAMEGGAGDMSSRFAPVSAAPTASDLQATGTGHELFQLPLALAFLLALAEAVLGLWGRHNRQRIRFADELRHAMRRPAMAVVLFAIFATQSGWSWYPSWLPNREAGAAYGAGDYGRAGKLLDNALQHDDDNFGLQYNRANVAYQQKQYGQAIARYKRALELADPSAKPMIAYNMGNALFRQAEAKHQTDGYKQAISAYEEALKARPNDADVRHNLEVAKARLAQKQPPKSQQQQQGNQGGQQGQNKSGSQQPIGRQQQYNPPETPRNLPQESEIDQTLDALESDERQRQAEQAAQHADEDGGPMAQQLLNQAMGALDLQKDW